MELSTVQFVGHIIAWFILIIGYILMGMLAYHTIIRAWKGEQLSNAIINKACCDRGFTLFVDSRTRSR